MVTSGGVCVTTIGTLPMQLWCADSWDIMVGGLSWRADHFILTSHTTHTCTHTCTHLTHVHMHTPLHTSTPSHLHTPSHMHTPSLILAHTLTHTHTLTLPHMLCVLGYSSAVNGAYFGQGTGLVLLGSVLCSGLETSLVHVMAGV